MSRNRFDEKWLRAYQKRTGCKVRQTGGAADVSSLPKEEAPEPYVLNPRESALYEQMIRETEKTLKEGGKRNKYGNKKVDIEGNRFDSKHEARVYERLRLECLAGEHAGLARQAAFYLPGGVKYMADFVLLEKDGNYRVLDAKSEATKKNAVYRLKKRQMKNCLGVDIEEV